MNVSQLNINWVTLWAATWKHKKKTILEHLLLLILKYKTVSTSSSLTPDLVMV